MSNLALLVGALLVALGVYAYTGSVSRSAMSLIPAMFGAVFIVCGLLATRGEAMRKHAMHAAAAVALLGIVAGIGPLAMGGTDRFPPLMIRATTGMMILSAVFLVFAVRSFVRTRRARELAGG